jgi:hypothetical protein
MERLWKYCKSGALIVVDYNDYGFKSFLIGVLPPNSVITPMTENCKVSKYYPKGLAHYRMVELKDCIRLNHCNSWARPLLVLQPRQGNVVHWTIGNIDTYVKNLYKSILTNSPFSSNLTINDYPFTDYQWEVLCSEYLRREVKDNLRIDYLLTPIGRTMKDVDIDGANKDTAILAQVSLTTNPKEVSRKIASLSIYSKNTKSKDKKTALVYFGPNKVQEIVEKNNTIIFVPIERVLKKLETIGIIEDMIPHFNA